MSLTATAGTMATANVHSANPNFPLHLSIAPSRPPPSDGAQGTLDESLEVDQASGIEKYGIAGRIWEAAYLLHEYMTRSQSGGAEELEFDPPFLQPSPTAITHYGPPVTSQTNSSSSSSSRCVIELGSGTGANARVLADQVLDAQRGDLLVATDLPDVCSGLLGANLRDCSQETTLVRPLSWGSVKDAERILEEVRARGFTDGFTDVVCSDLVYFPELLAPLLRTLIHLTNVNTRPTAPHRESIPHPSTTITIAYKVRSLAKETPFWSAFGTWFDFQPVLVRSRSSLSSPVQDSQAPVSSTRSTTRATQRWTRFGLSRSKGERGDEEENGGAELDGTEGLCFIFVARRNLASLTWSLPHSDEVLMRGGDDTFETLLLMDMDDDVLS